MGLDMSLFLVSHISQFDDDHKEIEQTLITVSNHERREIKINGVVSVTREIASWRKANAIHNWFVQHVQDGDDDCDRYKVGLDDLLELKKVCEIVRCDPDNITEEAVRKARGNLPTKDGFYFGSTDYNRYYFEMVDYTIGIIDAIEKELKEEEKKGIWYSELFYDSSW